MRSLILAALAATLPAPLFAKPVPAAPRFTVVDHVGDFDAIVTANAGKPDLETATLIQQRFATILPGFYDAARMKRTPEAYTQWIADRLPAYRDNRAATFASRQQFNAALAPVLARFEAVFGPVRADHPAQLVVSLGEMDGGTRTTDGGKTTTLFFGADMIAKYHGAHDPSPFFAHELFHVVHEHSGDDCGEGLWCNLWEEGLATYVGAQFAPGASDAELLLTIPAPLRGPVEANPKRAYCAVLRRLDKGGDDYAKLFLMSGKPDGLPPRFGYYVGYRVAQELGQGQSLPAMAAWKGKPLRLAIEGALHRLAGGSCDGVTDL